MVVSWKFAVAAAFTLLSQTLALPLTVHPGDASDIIITAQDTVNGTTTGPKNMTMSSPKIDATQRLQFAFVNNIAESGVNAYVTGTDSNNAVVMLSPSGGWYYPNANGASTPQAITENVAIPLGGLGSTTTITLPDYISAGRIWFAVGTLHFYTVRDGTGATAIVEPSATNPADPSAGVNWGFVELTNTASAGLFANISYVDFVGLVLGMTLKTTSGAMQYAGGLKSNAVSAICSKLVAQSKVHGVPWNELCVYGTNGQPLRVLAPTDYISIDTAAFSGFFSAYIDRVWAQYTNEELVIDTQEAAGNVNCKVTNNVLYCNGDNRGYAKPVAKDIFGCNSGPFAIQAGDNSVHYAVVPRLCAAFNRSTLTLPKGNVQPGVTANNYYLTGPTNWYSAFVHELEVDGTGYAFSYDDVTPDSGTNQSGVVSDPNPELLTITIGGSA